MKKSTLLLAVAFVFVIGQSLAQLTPYEDFETSDQVTYINTIKVKENMMPYYLEKLKKTWFQAVKFQKEKGYILDYKIWVSDLPNSGDFNLITMVTFANEDATRGNEEIFKAVTAHMDSQSSQEDRDKIITKDYPKMRKITGQYRIRTVEFK